jgi:hypothetical protein
MSNIELIDNMSELLKEWRNGFGRTQSGLNKLRIKTDQLLEIVDNTDFSLEDPVGWANSNDLVQDGYSHTFTVRSEPPANGYVDGGVATPLYTKPQK